MVVIHDMSISRVSSLLLVSTLALKIKGISHNSGRWEGRGVEDERNPQRKTHFEV